MIYRKNDKGKYEVRPHYKYKIKLAKLSVALLFLAVIWIAKTVLVINYPNEERLTKDSFAYFIMIFATLLALINFIKTVIFVIRNSKYEKIMEEEGITQNYIDTYIKNSNVKDDAVKYKIGSFYLDVYNYVSAEEWFNRIKNDGEYFMKNTSFRAEYYLDWAILFFKTGRFFKGRQILYKYRNVIEEKCEKDTSFRIIYNSKRTLEYCINEEYSKAIDKLEFLKTEYGGSSYGEMIFVYLMYVYIYFCTNNHELMEEEKKKAKEFILTSDIGDIGRSKLYAYKKLEDASNGLI